AQWGITDAAPPAPYFPNSWQTLAFLNNMFVYMGQADGSGYSVDGVNWQHVAHGDSYTTGAKATFPAAQFAYGNGIYIAVGSSRPSPPESVPAYRTSTDGQNWSDDIPLGNNL